MTVRYLVCLLVLLLSSPGYTVTFLSFDAESMSLGGAGSATGIRGYKPFLTPALPASQRKLISTNTYISARVIDRQRFIRTLEEIQEAEKHLELNQRLRAARSAFKGGELESGQLRDLSSTANLVLEQLDRLPDKPLRLSAAAGFHIAIQDERFGGGFYTRRYYVLGSRVINNPEDFLRVRQLAATADALADVIDGAREIETRINAIDWKRIGDLVLQSIDTETLHEELLNYTGIAGVPALIDTVRNYEVTLDRLGQYIDLDGLADTLLQNELSLDIQWPDLADIDLRNFMRFELPDTLQSEVIYSGAEVTESAVSLSTRFDTVPALSIGVNIKHLQYATIAYRQKIEEFDLDRYLDNDVRTDYSFWNLDIGLTYKISPNWAGGIVVNNVFPKKLYTRFQDVISVEPIARMGLAYHSDRFNWAVDFDLTRNEPLGFDPEKKYLSTGIEYRYWKNQRIRLGYRYNIIDRTSLPSAGLRFQIAAAHIDIAAAFSEPHYEAGLALQLGLEF